MQFGIKNVLSSNYNVTFSRVPPSSSRGADDEPDPHLPIVTAQVGLCHDNAEMIYFPNPFIDK